MTTGRVARSLGPGECRRMPLTPRWRAWHSAAQPSAAQRSVKFNAMEERSSPAPTQTSPAAPQPASRPIAGRRRRGERGGLDSGVIVPTPEPASPVGQSEIVFPWPIDLGLTVASHGWVHLEPWRWHGESGTLSRAEQIDGRLGTITLRQTEPQRLTAAWDEFGENAAPEILKRVRRWVSAEWDPAAAIAALGGSGFADEGRLVAAGGGRLLRCSTFYEDFVKTVLTVNTSWSCTCRMSAALVAEPGGGAFPSPQAVLDYGEERLRGIAKTGFRAPTLVAATERMLVDGSIDRDG